MARPLHSSRVAIAMFAVAVPVLVADIVIIFAGGHPALGKLLGIVGCLGVLAAVWVVPQQHVTAQRDQPDARR